MLSIVVEKAVDKMQYSFMINTLLRIGLEGNLLNQPVKGQYEKSHINV